ncbi:alpha/beta fold hydrolase [Gordonia insulae]|uniref:2-(Acetamidomethylene)succinate hydrolase n=1 Tax=Gordonia insulae TaxID=2420509 RepID=A0A3G8JT62_9ACTN|nr:alpha/beta hydrolase [Gordonia insulae]AZG47702.1 2-(acetamidomethylene)succinate hydrolase [Gordonia insulae]
MPDTTTAVRLRGDGVTLAADRWDPVDPPRKGIALLLHGGGQTRHSWQHTGRRLADHGWTAITIDARGHGESDWADDGDYSISAHARDLAAVVAGLDSRPVLVGASLGGMTSLIAQGTDPTLARALVLVDITPRAEPEGLEKISSFMHDGLAGFDSLEDAAAAVSAYNPHRRRPPRPDGLRKNLRLRDGRWYWHWDPRVLTDRANGPENAGVREEQARDAARSITVPTLLIRGAQSDVVSAEGARDLLELIPAARQIDVSGAGHMVSGDDNDVLSEGLIEFLDDV